MQDLLSLSGRTALVTGAGQGVGRQIALTFAAHGAAVVVNDFYLERAEAVVGEIEAQGSRALAVQCDVTDHAAVCAMVARGEEGLAPIDILVNNAGNAGPETSIEDATPFWETGPEEWAPWLGANFFGVLNCTKAAVGGMVQRGHGRVVTIVSDAGRVGEPNLVVYSAAKAGAAGFTRALAKAVGRAGVTANCVALSAMRTPATAGMTADDDVVKRILRSYVVRRLGEPDDAANMALFLASDAASWITGQTYPVNGGYAMAV
ncbi:SDR family oxidoreductase [Baekduia soli]|uniref:SDR family oxidoreductase n=1 Tax=Baekduia soli TaxID=496014 RepID=A0A5B8UBI0_9ACTN|nr:SDR family NAD(P)-dependent oxidoreductase [Baekduia soli]QEC50415.1 SDR family oxidoreductase [Baekduia soli]